MRSGDAVAGPGERLQQMRLAEPDARMDVERIEHHRLAAPRRARPAWPPHARACWSGRPRRCRTPAADRAASRRAPRARPAPGAARRARRRARRAALDLARRLDRLARLRLGGGVAQHRGAMDQIDAPHRRQLRLPAGEQLVGVVRLHPALEEAGRHREPHGVALDGVVTHGGEPALEDLLADRGAQPLLHAQPAFLIGQAHGRRSCGSADRAAPAAAE